MIDHINQSITFINQLIISDTKDAINATSIEINPIREKNLLDSNDTVIPPANEFEIYFETPEDPNGNVLYYTITRVRLYRLVDKI